MIKPASIESITSVEHEASKGENMKMRKLGRRRNFGEPASLEDASQEYGLETREPTRGSWSTAFLMVGSALVGATAIAFWNRRTIASMRAQIQARPENSIAARRVEEEIL